jgi:hypothetical protein
MSTTVKIILILLTIAVACVVIWSLRGQTGMATAIILVTGVVAIGACRMIWNYGTK